jgi:hypothetical protein
MDSRRPMLARGDKIASSIIITTFPVKFLSGRRNESMMLSVSARLKTIPVKMRLKQERAKKKINTFLANDSRRV